MASRTKRDRAEGAWLKPRQKTVLLEVSNDWLKLLEVHAGRQGLKVVRAHLEPLDRETVVAESLHAAVREKGFTQQPVLSCIPRQVVNVRLLELPSIEAAELQDMIDLQIGRQTPYSMREILSGYKVLGQTRQGTYTRVLLGIVPRSIVRERYYSVEDAGLSVERMTISSEGVMNWFLYHTRHDPSEKATLLLDVDSYFTHMLLVRHRKVVFSKSILWGASQIEEGTDGFIQRLQEACRSGQDAMQGDTIDAVQLSGAPATCTDEIAAIIEKALDVPCKKVDVLADVAVDAEVAATLRDDAQAKVSVTGLIGMAMSPDALALHFVPDVYAMRTHMQQRSRIWTRFVAALIGCMLAGSLYILLAAGYRLNRLQDLRMENAWLAPQVQHVERMVEVIRATLFRLESFALPEQLLPIVHGAIPDGVYVNAFTLDLEGQTFSLEGTAPSRRDIRDLISGLEETAFMRQVEEAGGTAMGNDQRFRFQVSGLLEKVIKQAEEIEP